jgi:hypothetical protein
VILLAVLMVCFVRGAAGQNAAPQKMPMVRVVFDYRIEWSRFTFCRDMVKRVERRY